MAETKFSQMLFVKYSTFFFYKNNDEKYLTWKSSHAVSILIVGARCRWTNVPDEYRVVHFTFR